jgi:hypothetical protein
MFGTGRDLRRFFNSHTESLATAVKQFLVPRYFVWVGIGLFVSKDSIWVNHSRDGSR